MTVGVFSTIRAANLQQHISLLNDALSIRLWFSCGINSFQDPVISNLPNESTAVCPLIASLSASESIRLPSRLLNLALILYVVGFGLFLLFRWTDGAKSTNTKKDDQDIFVFLSCMTTTLLVVFFVLWWFRKKDATSVSYFSRVEKYPASETAEKKFKELNGRLASCQEERKSRRTGERQEEDMSQAPRDRDLEERELEPA